MNLLSNRERELLRQYLLGNLSQEKSAPLEARLLSDSHFYQELLVTEDDLVDQYVEDRLSGAERESFELHFMIPGERRQKVSFARALRRYINLNEGAESEEHAVTSLFKGSTVTGRQSAKSRFQFWPPNPVLAFSVLVAVCLGLLAVSRVVFKRQPSGAIAQHAQRSTTTIALVSGSTRSEGITQRIVVPREVDSVQLELALKRNAYQSYKAELLAETSILAATQGITPEVKDGQAVVHFVVPAEMLKPGDFQIRLSGVSESGDVEAIDRYPFRVVTR